MGVGFAFAAVAFISSPWREPQSKPSIELVAVGEPEHEAQPAVAAEPVPPPEPDPTPPPEPLEPDDATPVPAPEVIYSETGAIDTYDAQLALARRLKRGSRAVAAYRRAIELNPQGSPALAELARLMLARNNTREATELAERATAIDPSNALAWVTLGAARQTRGDRQGARQAYQNCVKLGQGQYVSECRAMLR
jgi:predicted Zn-dependent protease